MPSRVAPTSLSFVILLGVACTLPSAGSRPPIQTPPAAERDPAPREAIADAPPPPAPPIPAPPRRPERRPGAWANLDPDDDFVVGPPDGIDDCEGELKRAGVTFARATLAVHEERSRKNTMTCGAPQVVTYLKGPGAIVYNPPPLLTCAMAAALASFERIAQEEAMATFKTKVVRIDQLGTYNCRDMAARPGRVSEHSYANAIDLARFVLKDGRTVEIVRDFDAGDDEPRRPGGRFLRTLSRRAHDEDVFSHVLTPFWDALHRNHFHLDLSRYRADGTRPRT